MTFCGEIFVSQWKNPDDFGDYLVWPVASPLRKCLWFSFSCLNTFWMDCQELRSQHSFPPQDDLQILDDPFVFTTGLTIRFNNNTMCIMIHGWWCDTRAIWAHLVQHDTIQQLEMDAVTIFSFPKIDPKKAYFCAVLEDKQWKSLIHWTPQTFSSRPRFNLIRLKISRPPAASCRDPASSEETLLTQHTRTERWRMNWSNLYNYLLI